MYDKIKEVVESLGFVLEDYGEFNDTFYIGRLLCPCGEREYFAFKTDVDASEIDLRFFKKTLEKHLKEDGLL